MTALLLHLLVSGAAVTSAVPPECAQPPSRVSEAYWLFVETCGCASLTPPSRASLDHERYVRACAAWRQANPDLHVTLAQTPAPGPAAPAGPTMPATSGSPAAADAGSPAPDRKRVAKAKAGAARPGGEAPTDRTRRE